jgi:hypothetical protein
MPLMTWLRDASAFFLAAVLAAAMSAFFVLIIYGVTMLVFRHAFGVELPNPLELLTDLRKLLAATGLHPWRMLQE